MKCRVCREPAVLDIRRHNAAFCADHFVQHCHEQVRRAIDEHRMFPRDARVLVPVSGGKDSLALWSMLRRLGYAADGLYVGLGIGQYSDTSATYARDYAQAHHLTLIEADLADEHGFTVPSAAEVTHRSPCGACGLSKRYVFNAAAIQHGYDTVATGHNLDDEAAVLLGNVLRWETGSLGRQHPVLPAAPGFVRKVKPLIRLGERETAAYCVLLDIGYQVEECPMAAGNRHLTYKDLLNTLEDRSPGSKAAFMRGFLDHGHERFASDAATERADLTRCRQCGAPTTNEVCAFCRLSERAGVHDTLVAAISGHHGK